MKKIICPKCKGHGEYMPPQAWFCALFTLGVSLAVRWPCEICEQTGLVTVER